MYRFVIILMLLCCCFPAKSQNLLGNPYSNSEISLIYDAYTQCKWGTAFQSIQSGYLYKFGMYIPKNDVNNHVVQVWTNEGNKYLPLAGPFTWSTPSEFQGWSEFEFPSVIEINATRTYIISIINENDPNTFTKEYLNLKAVNTPSRNSGENSLIHNEINPSINWHIDNSIRVAVAPKLSSGSIGSDQVICYNTAPVPLSLLTSPSGGTGIYLFQWQSSIDNINWSDINEANGVTITPDPLKVNTWFRCKVISGNFKWEVTNVVKISVIEIVEAGTIGSDQAICFNTRPLILTEYTEPTGGTDNYVYQWQYSTDNLSWIDINGATNQDFSPPQLTTSTWYRRKVTSGNCAFAISNSVLITVYSNLVAGTIGSNQSICFNSQPDILIQLSTPTGGSGTYNYQWQSSIDNINWTNIEGASSASFRPPALTSERWYRRNTISGPCIATSNIVYIYIYPILNAGTIGYDQTICYNTTPNTLVQISEPSGGTGEYSFQWQNSSDNNTWANISNANLQDYSPPVLTSGRWYRRIISAGCNAASNTVRITLHPQLNSAQLHDSKTIPENSSTTFYIGISDGTPPYTVNYALNGSAQSPLINYINGSEISTGILAIGTYNYVLTRVTDSNGCQAQSLGSGITINASSVPESKSNKALAIVNSSSSYYSNFVNYVAPYLDNFGIPYDICNISTMQLPSFEDYSVIIFGHRNVYSSGYPLSQIESSVYDGVGLVSFDPHLFDYSSSFNNMISLRSVNSNTINITNTSHFITRNHTPDSFNPTNNLITLLRYWSLSQNSNLNGAIDLVTMNSGGQTIPLLQVSNYGTGKIVKWSGYDWMFESYLGPVYGMDDLIWRGIVWAARKPFIMQGLPPMVTMRVDDVEGNTGGSTENFIWIEICNEYGIIPWCGTYYTNIRPSNIPTLKRLTDNNLATSSPHAINGFDFIYFNHNGLSNFDAAANVRNARNFYIQNGLRISKYVVPHYYEISSAALGELSSMGVEFIGIHMLPDQFYNATPPTSWINCSPYRINRNGYAQGTRPVYYGGYVNLNGYRFFNCLAEIRDDGTYEWFPDNDIPNTVARGIRHLRRSFNSMVLASLFTHEYFLEEITTTEWREIIRQITTGISGYNPYYCSTDYAIQYIRAKNNIRITNVIDNPGNVEISYSGTNDMATRCYFFYEQNGQIIYRLIDLPRINGSNTVVAPK